MLGYAVEFGYSWLRTAGCRGAVWRGAPFEVIQACNPPDTYWLLARAWKRRDVRFVFDQHDLNPELFLSRFGEPQGRGGRLQLRRAALAGADDLPHRRPRHLDQRVLPPHRHRSAAGCDPDDVTVVRSGPDTEAMRPVYPADGAAPRERHILVYLGIMGPQDGVDVVLEVMHELVHVPRPRRRARRRCSASATASRTCAGRAPRWVSTTSSPSPGGPTGR